MRSPASQPRDSQSPSRKTRDDMRRYSRMIVHRHLSPWGGALVCLVISTGFAAAPGERASAKGGLTVDAPAGRIAGQLDGRLRVFKGIPYALPPVGPARW